MEGLKTGELAKKAEVNLETIRFYERKKLISPVRRLDSGYRVFTEETVRRIKFIKHAQDLGFTLKEISELLSLRVKPGAKCGDIQKKAEAKMEDIESKINMLNKMKNTLIKLSKSCQKNQPTDKCPILEALDQEDG